MIFVTVGTHYQGFDRLIKKMDEIAAKIDDEVIMQIGHTEYEPKNAKWFKFLGYNEIINYMAKSDILICHGGAGTLLDVLCLNKPIIIVPRLKKYDEAYDDHELELGESLKKTKNVLIVPNMENLERNITELNLEILTNLKNDKKLVNFLRDYLRS